MRLLTGTNAFVTHLQGIYIIDEFTWKLHRSIEPKISYRVADF
jgi:hypothetical protein